ncbi:hypothetical protein LPJ61_003343 [Coemansia biformis]|uniref:Uncharacterized protein n=1 Tax=Coemansia biformis TaxID=1286918 RepID=A0A9W7YCR3_9FUNG|nr:hypothetical protein LPJ61_003343 [Coemansia biformis]
MESVQGSDKLELTICDHTLPVLPESFICTAMTRLMISGPTNLDTMFGLIQHLPNLVELALYLTYPYRGPYPDMTIPEAGSRTPAWPFRTKLMMVDIEFNNDWPSPTLTVALAKYLLLKIPTLTKLVAKQTPQQRILDFVEGYAGQYPHLGSIEFRLYEGDETDFERDH